MDVSVFRPPRGLVGKYGFSPSGNPARSQKPRSQKPASRCWLRGAWANPSMAFVALVDVKLGASAIGYCGEVIGRPNGDGEDDLVNVLTGFSPASGQGGRFLRRTGVELRLPRTRWRDLGSRGHSRTYG